jgi:hypothetical protein
MISQIKLNKQHAIPRQEAVNLGFSFLDTIGKRLGIKLAEPDDGIQLIESYIKYTFELTMTIEEDIEVYRDIKGDKVSTYYIAQPIPEKFKDCDFVIVEQVQLVDLLILLPICPYPFTVIKTVKDSNAPANIQHIIIDIEERLTTVISSLDLLKNTTFNSKCNVHIGGGLLLTINDVMLEHDCCTDILQERLNGGWRIVASSPQPDQRRPDYILGRYNPNKEA